jgi:two-component system cell cycle response regulator DivK
MARVLVIEDNPSNFKLFEMILKSSGYEVLWAKNGQEGLAFALEGQSALILLDVSLPVIDGFEVARRLKADERTARTPIIVVSAQAMQEDIRKAMDLGVEGYITKPFRYKELLESVKRFLSQEECL